MDGEKLMAKGLVERIGIEGSKPVSYTHLDVYKRQSAVCSPRVRVCSVNILNVRRAIKAAASRLSGVKMCIRDSC